MWLRRGPSTVIVITALVGVLVVTWAATVGPSGVLQGDGPTVGPQTPSSTPTPTPSPPSRDDETQLTGAQHGDGPLAHALGFFLLVGALGLGLGLVVVGLGVLLLLGYLLVLHLWEVVVVRHRKRDPDDEVGFEVLDASQRLARAMAEDASQQRALLTEGTPRNAIVRCWRRFEELAAEAGLARKAWETPGEFALRMLAAVGAEEDGAYRLTILYREARFSHHELGESARDEALEALGAIHVGLAERSGNPW